MFNYLNGFLFNYRGEGLISLNRTQRFLLLYFAFLIMISSDSYLNESSVILKLFLTSLLLFFGFSPTKWFRVVATTDPCFQLDCKNHENEEREENEEHEDQIIEEEGDLALPNLGFSNREQVLILKTLIKLRSFEIGSIYRVLRDYQESAGEGNWVPFFMKRFAVSNLYYAHYVIVEKEDEKKAEDLACEIYEKNYKFCSIAPVDLYEDEIADLQVALGYWTARPGLIIKRLEEMKSFGVAIELIDSLIIQYKNLESLTSWGDFEKIFIKDKSSCSLKCCLEKISVLWSQVCRMMKMNLLLNRVRENLENEESSNEDMDLKEIEALLEMERHLDFAINQENSSKSFRLTLPSKEQENFFIDRLNFNPFFK